MSKVLRMIDFDELITWQHEQFLIEEGMKNENITDDFPKSFERVLRFCF